jgi:Leucine-rich repeat (LRR) protein
MFILKKSPVIALIIIAAINTSLCASEQPTTVIEQTSPLCDMPPEIIQHIASFLPSQRDAAHLGATCKYLNQHAIIPFTEISFHFIPSRRGSLIDTSYKEVHDPSEMPGILAKLTFDMHTIAKHHGSNPITIWLQGLNLGGHMKSLKKFLHTCSNPLIAPHIRNLCLNGNRLPYIPEEIAGLTNLQNLDISGNPLKTPEAIRPITRLEGLKILSCGGIDLTHLDDDFGKFKALENLNLGANRSLHSHDMRILARIKTLRYLGLVDTKITYDADFKLLAQLPNLKMLDLSATRLTYAEKLLFFIHTMKARGIQPHCKELSELDEQVIIEELTLYQDLCESIMAYYSQHPLYESARISIN